MHAVQAKVLYLIRDLLSEYPDYIEVDLLDPAQYQEASFATKEFAAQTNGMIVIYSNISRDVNGSDQTIKSYFQILEDTLLGFFLPSYNESFRKSQGVPY